MSIIKKIFRVETYEIKKSRYPSSYYDVYEVFVFNKSLFKLEFKNNRYY